MIRLQTSGSFSLCEQSDLAIGARFAAEGMIERSEAE